MKWLLIFSFVSLQLIKAQVIKDGKCPEVRSFNELDTQKVKAAFRIRRFIPKEKNVVTVIRKMVHSSKLPKRI